MADSDHSTGYLVGRALARNLGGVALAVGGLVVACYGAVWLFDAAVARSKRVNDEQIARVVADAAKRRDEIAAERSVRRGACERQLPELLKSADQQARSGNLQAALDTVRECRSLGDWPPLKEAVTRYERASADLAAKKRADEAKEAARRERADLAQRKREGVSIGMTQDDVIKSQWGKPSKINRTTTSRVIREQWVYAGGYLYFENGILVTIQN